MSTIYVSPSGSDSRGDGSSANPFKTIGKASSTADGDHTIDTIQIAAGTYYETVTPPRDGLIYNGDRGPEGDEWLTIIDPSTAVTGKWSRVKDTWATEASVWQLNLGYQPGMFTYNGQCIECVGQDLMTGRLPSPLPPYFPPGLPVDRPGRSLLAVANTTKVSSIALNQPVNFWDGPYALAAYDTKTGLTYFRLADNGDPNDISLRSAPAILGGKVTYGIDISGVSYTTITNLLVQGAYMGIRISNGSHNTVKNCYIQHGWHRVYMQGDPALAILPHDNEISFNTFKLNMFGYASPGAYPIKAANASYDLALKEYFYCFLKYIVGNQSTHDVAIKIGFCGANNHIHHNIFEQGGVGIFSYLCDNTQIYANTFRHLSDSGVLASDALQAKNGFESLPSGEIVQCNRFSDVFQFIRYDEIDVSGGVRTNFHYFLSNTGENEPNLGEIVQFHMAGPPTASMVGKFALTIAGNRFGLTAAVFHTSGNITDQQGIPEVRISGNTFQSPQTIAWGGGDWLKFHNTKTMVGSFENNKLVDDMKAPPPGGGPDAPPAWYDVVSNRIVI
jgi:parallel beta-helix repeat protein